MKKLALSSSTLAALAIGALVLFPRPASATTAVESFKKVQTILKTAAEHGELALKVTAKADGKIDTVVTKNGVVMTGFPIDIVSTRNGDVVNVKATIDFDPNNYKVIRFGKNENILELVRKSVPDRLVKVRLDPKTKAPQGWSQEPILVEGFPLDVPQKNPSQSNIKATPGQDGILVEGFPLNGGPKDRTSEMRRLMEVQFALYVGTTATAKFQLSK